MGFIYEVGTMLGCYLLAQGVAEPVDEEVPALVPPWIETRFSVMKPAPEPAPPVAAAPPQLEVLSEAADRPRPRRRRRQRP